MLNNIFVYYLLLKNNCSCITPNSVMNKTDTNVTFEKNSVDLHNNYSHIPELVLNKDSEQKQTINDNKKEPPAKPADNQKSKKTKTNNLLHFRKWWERDKVEILVNGKLINGTPIFVEEHVIRVINDDYSYFIPLEKIDYIRTNDGLQSSFDLMEKTQCK